MVRLAVKTLDASEGTDPQLFFRYWSSGTGADGQEQPESTNVSKKVLVHQ